jgi:hypothetical protein
MDEESKPTGLSHAAAAHEQTQRYWDQLDAKFATMNMAPQSLSVVPDAVPASPASGLIAEAFTALLGLEEGVPGAKPVRLTTGDSTPPPPPEPQISDRVIDDIVRRVVQRLGPDAVRAVVVDVVSEISERLVREEIERIRNQHG